MAKITSTWRVVLGTTAFVAPITVTILDVFGYVAKVEGASMQVINLLSNNMTFTLCLLLPGVWYVPPLIALFRYDCYRFWIPTRQREGVSTRQTQNICIAYVQRRPNVSDVGPTLCKYYTNVLCLLGIASRIFLHIMTILWNAVTSPETVLNGNSVKRKLYKTPSPILHCIS